MESSHSYASFRLGDLNRGKYVALGRILLPLFLCLAAVFAAAPSEARTNQQSPVSQPSAAARSIEIDLEQAELRQRNAILEVRLQLASEGVARLEIFVALAGTVLAVVVIGFGISTRDAAVAAAVRGLEQDREAIRRVREEIDSQSVAVAGLSQTIVAQYRSMEEQAERLFEHLIMEILRSDPGGYRPHVGIADRSSIGSIALAAQTISARDRTDRQQRIILAKLLIGEEWSAFREAATQLETLHADDPEILRTAILYRMIGHAQAGDLIGAVSAYAALGSAFVVEDGQHLDRGSAKVMYYRARLEEELATSDDPAGTHLALYDDLCWRFAAQADDPQVAELLKLARERIERHQV